MVVGAGASGAPLAARLSEDPACQVLLIEAGPDAPATADFPADLRDAKAMTGALPSHPCNWAFLANLTPSLPYSVARGKILGGSTALNGTYYVRARVEDFDRWVAAGNEQWSWEKVMPFYKKAEKDLRYGESAVHGGAGPVPVSRSAEYGELGQALSAAFAELGFAAEPDKNDQLPPGYGPLPRNAVGGLRINTGIAYINPHRGRPNLHVRGNTLARRVVFDGTRAVGVEVESAGVVRCVTAAEVVLSAGAFNSPHLLMLSGIGPASQLTAAGIPVLADLPVGRDFTDHPNLTFCWVARRALPRVDTQFELVLNWRSAGSPYQAGDLEILPSTESFDSMMLAAIQQVAVQQAALRQAAVQQAALRQAEPRDYPFFSAAVQQAESRGQVTLVSADPARRPRIDYNYLSDPRDLARMREAIRTSARVLRTRAMEPWFERFADITEATLADDAALDRWTRTHLATAIHACGTCRMGPVSSPEAVVDQYGRVHGVTGLRVADTSIMPLTPLRGPAATAIMLGERIADFMRSPE